ncbi:hypothetical protein OG21DRAFT_1520608 [Imleria badia]|nr:hypothetical protein OG21DRAFT_1520608 [Imleria badia]
MCWAWPRLMPGFTDYRGTRPGGHLNLQEEPRGVEGDRSDRNDVDGGEHDRIRPRDEENERVIETSALRRVKVPEGKKAIESSWKVSSAIGGAKGSSMAQNTAMGMKGIQMEQRDLIQRDGLGKRSFFSNIKFTLREATRIHLPSSLTHLLGQLPNYTARRRIAVAVGDDFDAIMRPKTKSSKDMAVKQAQWKPDDQEIYEHYPGWVRERRGGCQHKIMNLPG